MNGIKLVYENTCPICGGEVEVERLLRGLGCPAHGNDPLYRVHNVDWIFKPLGIKPWGAQRIWARRFIRGESFALIAPTGSGKTTAIIAFAIARAKLGGKTGRSLLIFPNSTLAYQVQKRIKELAEPMGIKVIGAHTLGDKVTVEKLENSKIIITTSISLARKRDIFGRVEVDSVFVDDVDSFLRRSKAIDTVFDMLRISQSKIEMIERLLELKKKRRIRGEYLEEILRLQREVRLKDKQIVVSGATQSARRTKRVRILNELLGFNVGSKLSGVRNVLDTFLIPKGDMKETLYELVTKLGPGGLIFTQGAERAIELAEFLDKNGISAKSYVKASKKIFNAFANGEIDILVGTATSRSSLVRGIDLPEIVRYAIFYGVPKFLIRVTKEDFSPGKMLIVLGHISRFLENEEKIKCGQIMDRLRRLLTISRVSLEKVREGKIDSGYLKYAHDVMTESLNFLSKMLKRPEIREASNITKEGLVFPDAITYIHASGRTSRLTMGGMTQGLSIVIVDDQKAFKLMKEVLEIHEIDFKPLESIDLEKVMDEIDKSRRMKVGIDIEMKSTLLVVESPTKAATISHFYGKPLRREVSGVHTYEVLQPNRYLIVVATRGHFMDLDIDRRGFGALYDGKMLKVYFKPLHPEVIEALRILARDVDEVLVATDPDAEGEKIAWDVRFVISPFNSNIKRVRYHEVTRWAISEALEKPGDFDENLLQAQLLRRIQDAWIGLTLSKIVQLNFREPWLSAGRVQTPVLKWVIERTLENKNNRVDLVIAVLENGLRIIAKLPKGALNMLKKDPKIKLIEVRYTEREMNPPPPFTTDSLLIEAGQRLKMSPDITMRLAQDLFESGLITYHRTDSTKVSGLGMNIAKRYLEKVGLDNYTNLRPWGSEEEGAHECIRPTRPMDATDLEINIRGRLIPVHIPIGRRHIELYNLIFRRFMASQMSPIKVKVAHATFEIAGVKVPLKFNIEVIKHGFDLIMPLALRRGLELTLGEYKIESLKGRRVGEKPLYTEAELVRLMSQRGIGRPSTYAITVEKLKKRYYVYRVGMGRLVSTKLGLRVYDFLRRSYEPLINEERTRKMFDDMSKLEHGSAELIEIIEELYKELRNIIGNYSAYITISTPA